MSCKRFEGRVAIVTGGGSGMGFATAKRLVEEGAKVYIFDFNEKAMYEKLAELGESEDFGIKIDVSDEEQVKAAVAKVVEREGKIDHLVNMAGIPGPSCRAEDYTFEDFKRVYSINVFGTFLMMQNCLKVMQANKFGSIVNACSCSGMRGYELEIGYGSSKGAVLQLTKCAANENGFNGVRVNSIAPGWVDTNMLDNILSQYADTDDGGYTKEELRNGTMTRPATATEMANCICFLLSDEACYVNGSNFVIDGGKTLG